MKVSNFAVGATLKCCLRSALTPKIYSHSIRWLEAMCRVFRSYPILIVVFLVGGGN